MKTTTSTRILTALALLFTVSLSHANQYEISADPVTTRIDGSQATGVMTYNVIADGEKVCSEIPCIIDTQSLSEVCVSATETVDTSVQTGQASCVTLIAPPSAPKNIKITVTVEVE